MRFVEAPIRDTFEIRSAGGSLADPGGVDVTLIGPDGVGDPLSPAQTTTGAYSYSFTPTLAGRYTATILATGLNAQALPPRQYDVWPSNPRMLIPLDEARSALNLPDTSTSKDDELRLFICAATDIIEDIAGPIVAGQFTEVRDGGQTIVLNRIPTAVTAITVDGAALEVGRWVSAPSGIVRLLTDPGTAVSVEVTYTAGSGAVPANVILAARELVQFAYQSSQQRPGMRGEDTAATPAGFLVPRRVLEWLAPANPVPGFA